MNIINTQIFNENYYQNTINSPISFNGVGIHTGKAVNMTLFPSDDDFGIVRRLNILAFHRRQNHQNLSSRGAILVFSYRI